MDPTRTSFCEILMSRARMADQRLLLDLKEPFCLGSDSYELSSAGLEWVQR